MKYNKLLGSAFILAFTAACTTDLDIPLSQPTQKETRDYSIHCKSQKEFKGILSRANQKSPVWTGISDNGDKYEVYTSERGITPGGIITQNNFEWSLFYTTNENISCPVSSGILWNNDINRKLNKDLPSDEYCPNGYKLEEVIKRYNRVIAEGKPEHVFAGQDLYNIQASHSNNTLKILSDSAGNWALIVTIPTYDPETFDPVPCTFIEAKGKKSKKINRVEGEAI